MLTEFEGIIDSGGLSMFRQKWRRSGGDCPVMGHRRSIPFWAVLETNSAAQILRQLQIGNGIRALRLLEELAFDLGCEWEIGVFDAEIDPHV